MTDGFSRFLLRNSRNFKLQASSFKSANFYSCDAIIISNFGSSSARPAPILNKRKVFCSSFGTLSCVPSVMHSSRAQKRKVGYGGAQLRFSDSCSRRLFTTERQTSLIVVHIFIHSMAFCAPQSSTGIQEDQEFATIGQAQPTGGSLPLESVESEINFVERIVRAYVQTAEVTKLPSSESTREAALVLVVSFTNLSITSPRRSSGHKFPQTHLHCHSGSCCRFQMGRDTEETFFIAVVEDVAPSCTSSTRANTTLCSPSRTCSLMPTESGKTVGA
ncbi:hypothetical protein JOM56_013006 [Amanita muscaria]